MDFSDVIVHIFYEPVREFYDLDGLWGHAPKGKTAWTPTPNCRPISGCRRTLILVSELSRLIHAAGGKLLSGKEINLEHD